MLLVNDNIRQSQVKDILAADKQLATEIEFDLKKWEEEQQKNAEREARVR